MYLFYTPHITQTNRLPEEESKHCVRVLRLSEGDSITLTDGAGHLFQAEITLANPKACHVSLLRTEEQPPLYPCRLHVAVAPTKNMDRNEWFAEKATEIGVDEISFLNCRFSERKVMKSERIEKTIIAAMKQSLKAWLPVVNGMADFSDFIARPFAGRKFIAHCYESPKPLLKEELRAGEDALVLIGPEGDFSQAEVAAAIDHGFIPISLGRARLRTETAALVTCQTFSIINQ